MEKEIQFDFCTCPHVLHQAQAFSLYLPHKGNLSYHIRIQVSLRPPCADLPLSTGFPEFTSSVPASRASISQVLGDFGFLVLVALSEPNWAWVRVYTDGETDAVYNCVYFAVKNNWDQERSYWNYSVQLQYFLLSMWSSRVNLLGWLKGSGVASSVKVPSLLIWMSETPPCILFLGLSKASSNFQLKHKYPLREFTV